MKERERIRRAHFIEGKSIRQIQRETGHHRQTIRKALAEEGVVPTYRRTKARPSPVLGPVKALIDQWLAEDEMRPAKQRHTARRIYERLVTEYDFQGAESTVRRYVGQRRRALRTQAFIPLTYAPGHSAQVDFGQAQVVIDRQEVTAHLFCLRLNYSKQPFVMAFPAPNREAFLEGHVHAFHFLGGVPREIVYDNLKAAVKRVLKGRRREEQDAFIAFRSHYLFESRFCTPAQGHEKGLVEGLVGYARRHWFVPVPHFPSWDALNTFLLDRCQEEGERRLRGMTTTIAEALAEERPHLLPLPSQDAPTYTLHPVQANNFGLVTFQTNRYSVPTDHLHERLWLRAFAFRVEITNGQTLLAVHPRCYGREQDILIPLHYLPLLEQRPGAWDQAQPIQEWRRTWPAVYDRYLAALQERLPRNQAIRTFVGILRLHQHFPEATIAQALEEALAGHCYQVEGVAELVRRQLEPNQRPAPLPADALPVPAQEPVAWPDVAQFDRLLAKGGAS